MHRLIVLALLLSGCVHGEIFKQQTEASKAHWLNQFVSPVCSANPGTQPCGTISEDLLKQADVLAKGYCINNHLTIQECNQRWADMAFARFDERYPHANWKVVNTWCTANPVECDFATPQGLPNLEAQMMKSHNERVAVLAAKDQSKIRARAAAADDRQRQAWAGALQGATKTIQDAYKQPPTVHCESHTSFGTTSTDCH